MRCSASGCGLAAGHRYREPEIAGSNPATPTNARSLAPAPVLPLLETWHGTVPPGRLPGESLDVVRWRYWEWFNFRPYSGSPKPDYVEWAG